MNRVEPFRRGTQGAEGAMAYVDRVLLEDERIVRRPRFSRFAAYGAPLVEFAAIALMWSIARFALISAVMPDGTASLPGVMWLYVGGLVILGARFAWRMAARFLALTFSELAVTNRRYMEKAGVLDVSFWATDLEKIQRVEIEQPLLGRVFDYGDITIVTVGEVKHTTRAVGAPIRLQQALHARMTLADSRSDLRERIPRLSDERAAT